MDGETEDAVRHIQTGDDVAVAAGICTLLTETVRGSLHFVSMTQFFFHVRDGDQLLEDLEGSDHPDLDAARIEAIEGAREILANKVRAGELVDGEAFEITDETGKLLATVPFRDALRLS